MKKVLQRIFVFCTAICVFMGAMPVCPEAASTKDLALRAYTKLLTQTYIKWNKDGTFKVKSQNCSFALAYIDNNSVPELILTNAKDTYHATGYGALYTYNKGKAKFISTLDMNDTFYYYPKKKVYIDNYTGMGYSTNFYHRMAGTKATAKLQSEKNFNYSPAKMKYYKIASGKSVKISKANFKKSLSKLVGSTKKAKPVFYKNTSKNRTKKLNKAPSALTSSQLKKVAQNLGVPDKLNVTIRQKPSYYWETGDRWLTYVEVLYNNSVVAMASVDSYTMKPIKNIYNYSPS